MHAMQYVFLINEQINANFIIFVPDKIYRSHSSMDRIKDSGSFDLGSNPGGITKKATEIQWLFFDKVIYKSQDNFVIRLIEPGKKESYRINFSTGCIIFPCIRNPSDTHL